MYVKAVVVVGTIHVMGCGGWRDRQTDRCADRCVCVWWWMDGYTFIKVYNKLANLLQ